MLQKLLDAGAYTVAGNVIYPTTTGQIKVAEVRSGQCVLTPAGSALLAASIPFEPPKKAAKGRIKVPADGESGLDLDDLKSALDGE